MYITKTEPAPAPQAAGAWLKDKDWSDLYMPEVKRILGEHLITEAPLERDQLNNVDLIIPRVDVSVHIRRPKYAYFSEQFTIRCSRSYNTTELAKILAGLGDVMFYGIASERGPYLCCWAILDLRAFANWYRAEFEAMHEHPGQALWNPDGSSEFRAFKYDEVDPSIIIAREPYRPRW